MGWQSWMKSTRTSRFFRLKMEGKKLPSILPRHYSYRGTGKRSEILAAEVEGFRQPFAKAEDVPDLGQSNGTANNIETATLAYNGGLVIGSELLADSTYDITVLF